VNSLEQSAKSIIENYSDFLSEKGFTVSEISKNQYSFEINVFKAKERIKIHVYFGRKGNKVVLQGNKDSAIYFNLNELINGKSLFSETPDRMNEPKIYIGTDESGKGDYFGPLVVAGVFVDSNTLIELKRIGVKDSKELSDVSIAKVSSEIKKIVKNKYDLVVISPEKYNELYDKFNNLNKLLGWAHAKVLENVLFEHKAPEAISDKFGDENYIINSLQSHGQKIILHQKVRAEKFTAVAAASILARNKFNEWFEKKNIELKMKIPKGASLQVEKTASDIKRIYGDEFLIKLIKLHFKTSKKIKLI